MKSKLILILLLGPIFSGLIACNKIEGTQKKISGVWTATNYTFINSSNLTYIYPVEGNMSFGSCSSSTCNYDISISYVIQGTTLEKYNFGTIEFLDEEKFILHRTNADGTSTDLLNNRIILLTNDELKLEFTDEIGLHQLIFEK